MVLIGTMNLRGLLQRKPKVTAKIMDEEFGAGDHDVRILEKKIEISSKKVLVGVEWEDAGNVMVANMDYTDAAANSNVKVDLRNKNPDENISFTTGDFIGGIGVGFCLVP